MAALAVQQLRNYVRLFLDTDEEELPDEMLDAWRSEAQSRIARHTDNWPFYDETWTLTTVAGQRSYVIETVIASEVEDIFRIVGPRWVLERLAHPLAEKQFTALNAGTANDPTHWSEYGGYVSLWPTPSSVTTLTVEGQRKPVEPLDAGAYPDLPSDFHMLVGEYMLARAYEQQDDDVMSQIKFQRFETELVDLHRRWARRSKQETLQVGGGLRPNPTEYAGRAPYDWE